MGSFLKSKLSSAKIQNMEMIDEKEAAAFLGISTSTLRFYRQRKERFDFYKIGRRVLYNKKDLIKYMENNKVVTNES